MPYATKFKERSPQDTINILNKFFTDRGFTLNITSFVSESGTHSCEIEMYYDNHYVGHSAGKGINYDFCLASGLAEMYEDFCNYGLIKNYLNYNTIINTNKVNHDYYLDKNEKLITPEYIMNFPVFKETYSPMGKTEEQQYKVLDSICYHKMYGVPYKNALNNEIEYFNPLISITAERSNGMSAGNSYTEAFNQGFAEIIERLGIKTFYAHLENEYTYIPKEYLTNKSLVDIINQIESTNKKVYVLDLADLYDLPVVCVIILDLTLKRTSIRFGSFPVFDIALERCLTEMYQGVRKLSYLNLNQAQQPYRIVDPNMFSIGNWMWNRNSSYCLDEALFNRLKAKTEINPIYLKDSSTNEEISMFWKNLIQKRKWKVYVRDNSIIQEMTALHIILTDYSIVGSTTLSPNQMRLINWDRLLDAAENAFKLVSSYHSQIISGHDYYKWFNTYRLNEIELSMFKWLYSGDPTIPFWGEGVFTFDQKELNSIMTNSVISPEKINNFEYQNLLKYHLISKYSNSRKYNEQEIMQFLNLFGVNFTQEDLHNYYNNTYLIEKIYIIPVVEYIHSKQYKNFIQLFAR